MEELPCKYALHAHVILGETSTKTHLTVPVLAGEHEGGVSFAALLLQISSILEQFPGNLLVMR